MNYDLARENMIKQQVLIEGLTLDGVAKVMSDIPRELFLPRHLKCLAYCDSEIIVEGKKLRRPMVIARLIEYLYIKSSDNILNLGLECGYSVALLAKLSKSVEIIDYDEQKFSQVRRQLATIGIYNVDFNIAEHLTNIKKNKKKYDCIYISSTLKYDEIDEHSLLELLKVGGRVVFVVRIDVCDRVYIINKISNKNYKKSFIFDTYNQ